MVNKREIMCYVATDPKQPGAAFAIAVEETRFAKHTAKDLSDWIKRGALIERVTLEVAREMLGKWVRAEKNKTAGI